jgi:hypothetical protein
LSRFQINGIVPVIPTPFGPDEIDWAGLRGLLDFAASVDVSGVFSTARSLISWIVSALLEIQLEGQSPLLGTRCDDAVAESPNTKIGISVHFLSAALTPTERKRER